MAVTKKQREIIFAKSGGRCWYCGCELPSKGWHADHIKPVIRSTPSPSKRVNPWGYSPEQLAEFDRALGGSGMEKPQNDTIENMVPACAPCNLFKSVFSVEEFRMEIQQQINRARKTSVNFRTAERFGMIQTNSEPIRFWFENEGL